MLEYHMYHKGPSNEQQCLRGPEPIQYVCPYLHNHPCVPSRSLDAQTVCSLRARLDVRDRLVGVVSRAVREEVVDEHADDWEEEDDECPKDFVRDGTVRLEDLDCGTDTLASIVTAL
jgi:hypothetical protein